MIKGQRAYSIRTRIKTLLIFAKVASFINSQRAYSIRTRIKTASVVLRSVVVVSVREHIPLEQGLRLPVATPTATSVGVREHIPLEQGLRHAVFEI